MSLRFVHKIIFSVFFTVFLHHTMDFRARDQKLRALINDTLQDDTEGGSEGVSRAIQDTIKQFKDLLRKRTRTWWNHAFLEKYLIPRGLRIQVFPSFPIQDDVFINNWETLANTCSRGFMELLKQMNQESLASIESEMETLQVTLRRDMASDALKKFNEEMDDLSQKWAQEIQSTKAKKFQRDVEDNKLAHMYKWCNPLDRSRPQYRSYSRSRSRSTSMRSNISGENENCSKNYPSAGPSGSNPTTKRIMTRQTVKNKPNTGKAPQSQGGLQVLNLSSHILSKTQLEVLSRGLSFCPTNSFHFFTVMMDLHLFSRKLLLRKLHAKRTSREVMSEVEREALRTLEELLDEQSTPSAIFFWTYLCLDVYLLFG
ncbi:uncharacterized protein [Dendrobates tinctorius]|uniref:uncharacterized protein n=1 Tax=Dendrobates tinctorius TaxID=92724 RepID=UPI003CCA5578